MTREREVFERAVRTIAEQAAKTDAIVDEALAADLGRGSDRITVHVKMLRQELLDVGYGDRFPVTRSGEPSEPR